VANFDRMIMDKMQGQPATSNQQTKRDSTHWKERASDTNKHHTLFICTAQVGIHIKKQPYAIRKPFISSPAMGICPETCIAVSSKNFLAPNRGKIIITINLITPLQLSQLPGIKLIKRKTLHKQKCYTFIKRWTIQGKKNVYQCKGLRPSLSGASTSAPHLVIRW